MRVTALLLLGLCCVATTTRAWAEDSPRLVGNASAGEAVFRKTCAGCHAIGRNAQNTFGPQLNGVLGRQAGTSPGYKYSSEMIASGLIWSPDNLDAYVRDPGEVMPGTRMRFWGLSDAQKIADLMAFLKANP
jgi:cytochrome c